MIIKSLHFQRYEGTPPSIVKLKHVVHIFDRRRTLTFAIGLEKYLQRSLILFAFIVFRHHFLLLLNPCICGWFKCLKGRQTLPTDPLSFYVHINLTFMSFCVISPQQSADPADTWLWFWLNKCDLQISVRSFLPRLRISISQFWPSASRPCAFHSVPLAVIWSSVKTACEWIADWL